MKDSIIKLREQLVGLSKDPIETRKLLDQLTEEEIDNANIQSPFHVGEKDILETKDLEYAKVHRLRNGYLLHYHGGYSVLVDEKLITTCQALEMLKNGVPENMEHQEDKEALTLANTAIETIFRLPMFVFSNEVVLYSIAEIATRYLLLLQKMGEVPTAETENPEFDKFILQINDFMENFAAGLEKEGKEYEKRMGYGKGKEESDS
jgi:hypothetical protein